jgi:exonuclease III
MYYVIGGVFTDTTFRTLESDKEQYGPFKTYDEAYTKWKSATGWKIDICCHRLFINEASHV